MACGKCKAEPGKTVATDGNGCCAYCGERVAPAGFSAKMDHIFKNEKLSPEEEERLLEKMKEPGGVMLGLPPAPVYRNDPVSHPSHYTDHPSGVECIQITEHMNFCCGNAIKYIWRAGLKPSGKLGVTDMDKHIQDLEKAKWYIEREISRLTKGLADEADNLFESHVTYPGND